MLLDLRVSSSVQADDIALLSPTVNGMQTLRDGPFNFRGGGYGIITSTKHVGIILDSNFKTVEQTLNACRMLRSVTLSIMNSGIHPSILNPVTCSIIVAQLSYTKALYGCELWNELTRTGILMLERAHRFICRVLQGLPPRTRSDKCTSLLGWLTIESYIDKCKLLFFGRLYRLNSRHLPKRILISRLFEFKYQCVYNQLGFVPDTYRIAKKYDLLKYIIDFSANGTFPSKTIWKKLVICNFQRTEQSSWSERISSDSD